MIKLVSKGSWKKTQSWLSKVMKREPYIKILRKYGQQGVEALRNNTPVLTGVTAESWYYDIEHDSTTDTYKLIWANENLVDDWFNVALMIQLGHGTPGGTWVEGVDYINPALKPIFDKIGRDAWNEVSSD